VVCWLTVGNAVYRCRLVCCVRLLSALSCLLLRAGCFSQQLHPAAAKLLVILCIVFLRRVVPEDMWMGSLVRLTSVNEFELELETLPPKNLLNLPHARAKPKLSLALSRNGSSDLLIE
jgi:hypothetical protein